MDRNTATQLRSGARKNAAMPDYDANASEDLAHWLQEVARRPWVDGPPSVNPVIHPGVGPQAGQEPRRRPLQNGRNLVALAGLTIGFLQYYYLDVMVQIGSLHKVVIFVPLTTA